MNNAIYVMLSRQTALTRELTMRSNNIANAATTGFQAEEVMYNQKQVSDGRGEKIAFTYDADTFRRTTEGNLKTTGAPLDVAIKGPGYFQVETPLGTRYTRAGSFTMDGEGNVVNAAGYPVLDSAGQRVQLLPGDEKITIGERGDISVDGEVRGSIGMVEFDNPQVLEHITGTLYKSNVPPRDAETSSMQQGMLENSNVTPVLEITRVLDITRSVGSTAKFIDGMYELERRTGRTLVQGA